MQENIKVYVRIRSLCPEEKKSKEIVSAEESQVSINFQDISKLNLKHSLWKFAGKQMNFNFQKCFSQEDSNETLHSHVSREIVLKSMTGINSTIFVYGQTGSGKTFTMTGNQFQENTFRDSENKSLMKSNFLLSRVND